MIKPYDLILNNLARARLAKGSVHLRLDAHGAAGRRRLVHAQPHRLRPPRLCDRRRPDAARLAGINTDRTLVAVYALAGLICAIAAWVLIGRIGAVSPQAGQTANLDSITAVVIGGTSLFGGRGSIIGTLVGALIVGVFRNGLALSGARRAVAGVHRRRADHRRRDARSMDQEGFGMSERIGNRQSSRRAASSSAMAASSPSTMPISTSCRTRSWRSSATTAPASRR